MKYRAVPLLPLLPVGTAFDTREARAADGFVSQIPLALVEKGATGGAKAWIAIEDRTAPWPVLPGKAASAGPFYLVWENPERSGVGSEQWPYQLASITGVESPAHRLPTQYLTAKGLRGVIRNPKGVRTWPQMTMPGFDETMLRDSDLDALIAYLAHMATH